MKPPPFEYYDPSTVEDAVALLGRLDNAKILAGGQSLMPMLNMRFVMPDHVVDINKVADLSGIRDRGDALEIGAMTRQREIEFSELVRSKCPLITEAILQVGHRQTRNRGTIGGSLCHLDPAAELVAMAVIFDAIIIIAGPGGRREVPVGDFIVGYMTTALAPDEILVGVRFPVWKRGHGYAFIEFARRHGDFAVVSVGALLEADAQGRIARASVVIGGMDVAPRRATEVEQGLIGQTPSKDLLDRLCQSCRALEATDDIHASAAYRQRLAVALSRRALDKAISRMTRA
ncbi:MAG TPA: xanthine dehydrogenase family protein subunit M [Xanthobacteraceae bacterium]|jgi:carbon-monoxide dehydrogenase medium subunit|nr:xanthine dehydrogenase family protein subunit M [Xanthobacteraceae bacterium]